MFKQIERKRQEILNSLRAVLLLLILLACGLAYIIFKQIDDLAIALIVPTFLAFFIYIPIRSKKISSLKKEFSEIINQVLKNENSQFDYNQKVEFENLIDFNELYVYENLGLSAHQIMIDDTFICSCTFLSQTTSTDSHGKTNRNYKTIFSGVYVLFSQHQMDIKYKVDIIDKKSSARSYFDEVKFNDKLFNQDFRVFSQEQSEALELLDSRLINKIVNFKKEIEHNIDISFFGKHAALYIDLGFLMFNFSIYKRVNEDIFNEDILFLRKVLKFISSLN